MMAHTLMMDGFVVEHGFISQSIHRFDHRYTYQDLSRLIKFYANRVTLGIFPVSACY